jgi:hypothetical protein
MAHIGWHTHGAGRLRPEPPIFLLAMAFVGCLVLVHRVQDVLADTGGNITAEVGHADPPSVLSHGGNASDGPPGSHTGYPDSLGSREELERTLGYAMTLPLSFLLMLLGLIVVGTASPVQADSEILGFAVVSEAPRDKARVSAKVSLNDAVSDMKLLASETILNNLIWKKLEICHAMRIEGYKVAEGFQIVTVHVIDAGMLPMSLQSFAGDCLIKKAIEIAPLVD